MAFMLFCLVPCRLFDIGICSKRCGRTSHYTSYRHPVHALWWSLSQFRVSVVIKQGVRWRNNKVLLTSCAVPKQGCFWWLRTLCLHDFCFLALQLATIDNILILGLFRSVQTWVCPMSQKVKLMLVVSCLKFLLHGLNILLQIFTAHVAQNVVGRKFLQASVPSPFSRKWVCVLLLCPRLPCAVTFLSTSYGWSTCLGSSTPSKLPWWTNGMERCLVSALYVL